MQLSIAVGLKYTKKSQRNDAVINCMIDQES